MKVRAMIRPNKVSDIRSIGSSMRKEVSETSDIESNAHWLNLGDRFTGYFQPAMMCRLSLEVKAINRGVIHDHQVLELRGPSGPLCAKPT